MEVRQRATKTEGLEKGYLKNCKVKLMPIEERGMTLVTADKKNSMHRFSYDGAIRHYTLSQDDKFNLRDPFESDEERFWFESYFNRDLSTTRNSWFCTNEATVALSLDSAFRLGGFQMDLSNPEEMLQYKILCTQDDIAPSMDAVKDPIKNKPHWKFVLVNEDYEDNTESKKMKAESEAWTLYGRITDSKERMKDFLELYLLNNKKIQEVPEDPTEEFLQKEVTRVLKEDKKGLIETANDPEAEIKKLIIKGLRVGAIEKKGVNQFNFPGEPKYTFDEFVDYVRLAKEQEGEDIHDQYVKLVSRISISTGIKESKAKKKTI